MALEDKKSAAPVWIVENHPLAAQHLREILRRSGRPKILTWERGTTPRSRLWEQPSVVVVDRDTLSGPLEESLDAIRSELPKAKTLVLGRTVSCEDTCRLLLSGVKGVLPYEEVDGRLDAAIRSVSAGHLWVKTDVLEKFAEEAAGLSKGWRRERRLFTPAENRVLGLLQLGLSNKEIASRIGISERTVKFHLGNIFTKLSVRDRHSIIEMLRTGKLSGLGGASDDLKAEESAWLDHNSTSPSRGVSARGVGPRRNMVEEAGKGTDR
jgi:DNA-binding NarL/FixJ family response regulator